MCKENLEEGNINRINKFAIIIKIQKKISCYIIQSNTVIENYTKNLA